MDLTKLIENSKRLNDLSDELTESVIEINNVINDLNIGLVCWHAVNDYLDIGYSREGKKWGIAIRETRNGIKTEWLFDSAPRTYRIKVINSIPQLIEGMVQLTEATSKRLEMKIEEANKMAEVLETKN